MSRTILHVLTNPAAGYLRLLEKLPETTHIVAGDRLEAFEATADRAHVILCGLNMGGLLKQLWPLAKNVQWVHSLSAGVESVMFPELAASPVPLTNGRGVFRESLGEFAVAAAMFFAKDLRRMVASQQEGKWDPFDVEWICGKTMGIVGYGEIGRAAAVRARALGMRLLALRRRPELSSGDELLDKVYGPGELRQMLAASDYVLLAAPLTADTEGLIGEDELRAMKPSAVLMNVGRGPVVKEAALIRALRENWIRGAALDVFDVEPLPAGHAYYGLPNVLLSAHCADHTPGWTELAMDLFIENFERYRNGAPLENLVDKAKGY